jgi:hypothetical protein
VSAASGNRHEIAINMKVCTFTFLSKDNR